MNIDGGICIRVTSEIVLLFFNRRVEIHQLFHLCPDLRAHLPFSFEFIDNKGIVRHLMSDAAILQENEEVADLRHILLARVVDPASVLRADIFPLNAIGVRIDDGEEYVKEHTDVDFLRIVRDLHALHSLCAPIGDLLLRRSFDTAIRIARLGIYDTVDPRKHFLQPMEGSTGQV